MGETAVGHRPGWDLMGRGGEVAAAQVGMEGINHFADGWNYNRQANR
jgi:hypothetical protein